MTLNDKSKPQNVPGLKYFNHPFAEILAIGPFRSLWFGQICSQFAGNTLLFVLALKVYQNTGSNTAVSGLFLVYGVAALLFGLAGGAIVDKLESRFVLASCDFIRAVGVFAFFWVEKNIYAIYLLTFINALITQLYIPAEAPTIPKLVPEKLLVTANSLFSFTFFSSLAVGSIFAGPFLRILGAKGIFFFLSLMFLLAGLNVRRLPEDKFTQGLLHRLKSMPLSYIFGRIISNSREALEYIFRSQPLLEALLLLTATQVIFAMLGTLGPGFADKMLGIDIRDASLLITGPAVMGIIFGAIWVGSMGNKQKPEKLVDRGIVAAGILLIIISGVASLRMVKLLAFIYHEGILMPILLVLFFALGFANSLLDVPSNSILQQKAEGDIRGRVYGILTAAVGGIGILPVIIGGILADAVGVGTVIFLMGLLISGYAWWRLRYNIR